MRTCYTIVIDASKLAIADLAKLPEQVDGHEAYLLTRVNVPVALRGIGYGSMLLRQVLEDADQEQAAIVLEIAPSGGPGGMWHKALEEWYGRNGFVRRPLHHTYLRLPRKP